MNLTLAEMKLHCSKGGRLECPECGQQDSFIESQLVSEAQMMRWSEEGRCYFYEESEFEEVVSVEEVRCAKCKHVLAAKDAHLRKSKVTDAIAALVEECHEIARLKGWWENPRSDGELIALMHSELSEALEYSRHDPTTPSDHLPQITGLAEEMADVLIRIFDFCGERGINLAEALEEKIKFNKTRPHRHGGKRF